MLASHGGLTPPAPGGSAVRTFAGETATCAIHERSFTRAAGVSAVQQLAKRLPKPGVVSPPWFGNRPGNSERFLPNEDARIPRGAYAPRSCLAMRMSAGEKQFFRCTNAHAQERPAGRWRRGWRTNGTDSRNPIGAGVAEPRRLGNRVHLSFSAGVPTNSVFPPMFR
jgi:hypothetical protein